MAASSVYAAISAITAELATAGISKTHTNEVEGYSYRSIDDLFNRLAPLLAKQKLCVIPRVIERQVTERLGDNLQLLMSVSVRVVFTLVSADDGSSHLAETYGEALDAGDKATAKAMSAAFKSAMIQTFCISVGETEDADAASHKLSSRTHVPEPVQGWEQWVLDIIDIVSVCETEQAIDSAQERHRQLLVALSRERSPLYAELGASFTARREVLRERDRPSQKRRSGPTAGLKSCKRSVQPVQAEHV